MVSILNRIAMLYDLLADASSNDSRRRVAAAVLTMLGQALTCAGDDRLSDISAQVAGLPADFDAVASNVHEHLSANITGYVDHVEAQVGEPSAGSREAYFLHVLNLVEVALAALESGSGADFGRLAHLVDDQVETMVTLDTVADPARTVSDSIARVLAGHADQQHNVFARDARSAAQRPTALD